MHEENISCIAIKGNFETSERSKHVDVKYHFVRNKIADKIFEYAANDTDENTTGVFTKPLEKKKFKKS